jgi:hypothetical protein
MNKRILVVKPHHVDDVDNSFCGSDLFSARF